MPTVWKFRQFRFEPAERRLQRDGIDQDVGARALDVLRVLVSQAGHLVSKSRLLGDAWPGMVVEENNLQVQVTTLRRVLGADAIATVAGAGYRFEWPVQAEATDAHATVSSASRLRPPPEPLFPLVGRDEDLRTLLDACRGHRLVTLVGPAGIGKTRLAIAAAVELQRAGPPAELAFCDLTAISDGSLVAQAVSRALGLPSVEGDAWMALLAALVDRPLWLLLDNAEHLRSGVAEAVAAILAQARGCRVLVTSQVSLDLPGECLLRLEPLAVPAPDATSEVAAGFGAVALFVAYARAADRHFELAERNVAHVVEACRRLDGIPLALQLAAARLPQFGAAGLAARLDQRLQLLARSGGGVPARQRTLAAALDWSCELLEPAQRMALRRLSVFAGRFGFADAVAVAVDEGLREPEFTQALGLLVDRSLVVLLRVEEPCWQLPETVRLYALRQLMEADDIATLCRAIDFHAARAARAAESSNGSSSAIDYATALDLCGRLPAGAGRDERELQLLLQLGPVVQASSSPGSPRCESIYGRAVELARAEAGSALTFKALWGWWQFLLMAGRERDAARVAEELGGLSAALEDDGLQLEACHVRFSTAQLLGDADATLRHARAAIDLYVPGRHHALAHDFGGHDPGVCALGQCSVALWLKGRDAEALDMAARAERMGEGFEHAYSQAVGYYYAAMTYSAMGDATRLARAAQALVGVSERHAMAVLMVEGRLYMGRAAWLQGEREAGLAQLDAAYREIVSAGDFGFVPFYATLLADMLLASGQRERARAVIDAALKVAEAGQGFFVPELHRLRGELERLSGDNDAALDHFRAARELASAQGAIALLARVAASEALAAAVRSVPQ